MRIRKTLGKREGGLSVNVNGARVMFAADDVFGVARAWVEQSELRKNQLQPEL